MKWISGTLTYVGVGLVWWQTNWVVAIAVFLICWGFHVWNLKKEA